MQTQFDFQWLYNRGGELQGHRTNQVPWMYIFRTPEIFTSSLAGGGWNGKYCRCCTTPYKQPLPTAIGTILGNNGKAQETLFGSASACTLSSLPGMALILRPITWYAVFTILLYSSYTTDFHLTMGWLGRYFSSWTGLTLLHTLVPLLVFSLF